MFHKKLSTKEFAELCKVQKRTLQYYDEIDLLKPIEIKENGYRMYSEMQFETMSVIKALQSVGMSLADIKDFMKDQNLAHSKEVLNNQIHLLQEKQEELKNAEQILSYTTQQLEHFLEIGSNEFFIEKTADMYLVTQALEKDTIFINYIAVGYSLGAIWENKEIVRAQYIFKKANSKKESNRIKPAGSYACIYQSVPGGKIFETITSFVKLLSSKEITTEGPMYMDTIANDFIRYPNEECLFKLSIKCK